MQDLLDHARTRKAATATLPGTRYRVYPMPASALANATYSASSGVFYYTTTLNTLTMFG